MQNYTVKHTKRIDTLTYFYCSSKWCIHRHNFTFEGLNYTLRDYKFKL